MLTSINASLGLKTTGCYHQYQALNGKEEVLGRMMDTMLPGWSGCSRTRPKVSQILSHQAARIPGNHETEYPKPYCAGEE